MDESEEIINDSHRGRRVEEEVMNIVKKTIELSDGRVIEIETGKLAKQADGSVVVKMGGTMLLATVCCAKDAKDDVDFMPLQVDYKEKYASAGRFPGGFMKREGKASDYEILISRLIDRALRPLFPEDFHAEVFVNVNLISAEKDIQPDALAGLAASAALAVSDIPFEGPISEVRVARIGGELKINPNFSEMADADIDIMVAATMMSMSVSAISLKLGLILNSPLIRATRTSEIGPSKGMSLTASADEAARPASASGWMSFSAEMRFTFTKTSAWKSSGKRGLSARSTRRAIRIS